MSTTLPAAPRPFRRRWTDFWFSPADPTGLGFMRLVTGLLILYTHLTYSLDLQAFFGKHGWYGTAQIEDERRRYPWTAQSLTEWEERSDSIPLPEYSHRRKAYLDFLHTLAKDDAARAATADYLERVNRLYEPYSRNGVSLLMLVKKHPKDEGRILLALAEGRQLYAEMAEIDPTTRARGFAFLSEPLQKDRANPVFPDPMLTMPEGDRTALARDAREILRVLPPDYPGRDYFEVGHLADLETGARTVTARFLKSLDAETPARRGEIIDYLEHWNVDPRKTLRTGHAVFSPWFHVTDPTQMAAIHATALVVMFLFTIGFCTRVTAVLTWIAAVGYIHRTQQILFGMDTMMNILLIYLMVGNSGAALSVDRLIARYRAVRASLRRSGTVDEATRAFLAAPPPTATAGLAIRLFQVHFCFIYMAAGLSKLKGPGWWNGNAFWDVMVNPEFTLMRYQWFEDWIRSTASVKPLYHFLTATGVWFTWGLEIVLPFLVWTRLRPVMIWMAVILHASIGVLMGLNLFELMMMVMLLAFMPPSVIRARLKGGPDLPKAALAYDPADAKSQRAAAAVAAADVDGQVALEPRKGPTVVTADAAPVTGPAAVAALFARVRLLRVVRWVLWVPGVGGVLARWLFPTPGGGGGAPPSGGGIVKTPAAAS